MKKILSIILSAVLFTVTFGAVVFASEQSGKCGDNLTWVYSDNGTLTISGTGDMDNTEYGDGSGYTSYVWIDNGYDVRNLVLSEGVTSIGAYAFEALEELTSVVIPNGVTRIGMGAFQGSGITSVTLPSSLKQIDMGAFYDCPLSDIYFGGTSEQWNNINISSNYNENLINGNIHFTENSVVTTDQGISIAFGDTAQSQNDDITVNLNGSPISFDQPPIITNDRTMVPLRAIFEALGATVEWNGEKKTILASRGNTTILMEIGANKFAKQVSGGSIAFIDLDAPPMIVNDRTLVPVRAIAESFDCTVDWNGETRTVDIRE